MPAITFFAIRGEAEKQRRQREAVQYAELCTIASIPLYTSDYCNNLRSIYLDRLESNQDVPTRGALNQDDPLAIQIMSAMIGTAKAAYHV
jgi:hypothetical protein